MPSNDKYCGIKGAFYVWNEETKEYIKIGDTVGPLSITVVGLDEEKVGNFRRIWRSLKSFLRRILAIFR